MNKFDDVTIGYYGDDKWFRNALNDSTALVSYFNYSQYYLKITFDEFIELILEEKKKNWLIKERDSKINQILERKN